jgi:hypothetical protein
MEHRTSPFGKETTPPAPARGYSGPRVLDTNPAPDHADFVEVRANGLRATRERREKRRRGT